MEVNRISESQIVTMHLRDNARAVEAMIRSRHHPQPSMGIANEQRTDELHATVKNAFVIITNYYPT